MTDELDHAAIQAWLTEDLRWDRIRAKNAHDAAKALVPLFVTLPKNSEGTADHAAIQARLDAAHTLGPWAMTTQGGVESASYSGPGEDYTSVAVVRHDGDWQLIAHAPADIAALLAENKRLQTLADGRATLGLGALFLADAIGGDAVEDARQDYEETLLAPLHAKNTALGRMLTSSEDQANRLTGNVVQLEAENAALRNRIDVALDVIAHIVSQANVNPVGDGDFIERYDMPVGSIHKAIPFLARFGIVVDEYGYIHRAALTEPIEETKP